MAAPGVHAPCEHVPLTMCVVLVGQVFTGQLVPLGYAHLLSLPQVPAQDVPAPAQSPLEQQLPLPVGIHAPLEQVLNPEDGHEHTPAPLQV